MTRGSHPLFSLRCMLFFTFFFFFSSPTKPGAPTIGLVRTSPQRTRLPFPSSFFFPRFRNGWCETFRATFLPSLFPRLLLQAISLLFFLFSFLPMCTYSAVAAKRLHTNRSPFLPPPFFCKSFPAAGRRFFPSPFFSLSTPS